MPVQHRQLHQLLDAPGLVLSDFPSCVRAGARSSGLQPAHSQPRSDDLDLARAPTRPPLSGLRGSNPPQLPQPDWPPALQPTRSDLASNVHHLPSAHDHSYGQHEMHHDLGSPRSQSSQESRSSMASVATAPPAYTAHFAAAGPTRYNLHKANDTWAMLFTSFLRSVSCALTARLLFISTLTSLKPKNREAF